MAATSDRFEEGLDARFWGQLTRFIADSGGEVQPIVGKMDPADYKYMHQELSRSDPDLAKELGDLSTTPMTRGMAAMLHYPNGNGWAMKNAGRYGLRLREGFDHVVEPVGERLKHGPTDFKGMTQNEKAKHLMEIVEGTLTYRDPVQQEGPPGTPVASAGGM